MEGNVKAFVAVLEVDDPCATAYQAAEMVIQEDLSGKRILLKPNTGFDGPEKSGLCTHPEVVRGVVRFCKDQGASEIVVGDSSVIGIDSLSALKSAGIYAACQEEGVTCMDLNESGPIEKKIPDNYLVDSILLSNILYDVDVIISLPVMKTHMYTGATLGIKNMKGGMYKREKNKLHRIGKAVPEGRKEKSLDFGIRDLTHVLYPDYVITDGVVGMEGFGPSGGRSKPFGYITASAEAVACDMVSMKLMGLGLEDVGHINLVAEERGFNYNNIEVEPADYEKWAVHFQTPAEARLNLACDNLEFIDESACSGCHATLTQFLRYHADKFQDGEKITIFAGKDLDREEIKARGKNAYLVGNCTAKYRDLAPFCKGCPPVTSEIIKMVMNMYGVTTNNHGKGRFLLQTMNYRLALNPSGDLTAIRKAKPTHICVTDKREETCAAALALAKEFNAELYLPENAQCLKTGVIHPIFGKAGLPVKTEFGSVTYDEAGNVSFNMENMDLYFSFDMARNEACDMIVQASYDHPEAHVWIAATEERRVIEANHAFTYSTQSGDGQIVENASVGFSGVL
jgi:uncharacterized protein (DUF362 family)